MAFFETLKTFNPPYGSGLFGIGTNDNNCLWLSNPSTPSVSGLTSLPVSNSGNVVKFAGGNDFNVFLLNNGRILTAGLNSTGQCCQSGTQVTKSLGYVVYNTNNSAVLTGMNIMSGAVDIACGGSHVLVLDNNGDVWTGGNGSNGVLGIGSATNRPFLVLSLSGLNVTKIAGGLTSTAAIAGNGDVWVCGSNANGKIGLSGIASTSTWLKTGYPSGSISTATDIGLSNQNIIVKTSSGLWAAGQASIGMLGNNNLNASFRPFYNPVSGITQFGFVKLAIGPTTASIIGNSGLVYAWGSNLTGELGLSGLPIAVIPTLISGLVPVSEIVKTFANTYFLDSSGNILTCGASAGGANGGIPDNMQYPVLMPSGYKYTRLMQNSPYSQVGIFYTDYYIDTSPGLFMTGHSNISGIINLNLFGGSGFLRTTRIENPIGSGVFGCGVNTSSPFGFVQSNIDIIRRLDTVSNSGVVIDASFGAAHAAYLLSDGRILTAGSGHYGACGQSGITSPRSLDYMIYDQDSNTTLTSVKIFGSGIKVSCGDGHTLVLDASGTVWSCGSGINGALGVGDSTNRNWLVPSFSGLNFGNTFKIVDISAGFRYSVALDEFGRVWTCGWNAFNQQGHANTSDQTNWRLHTELSGAYPVTKIFASVVNTYVKTSVSGWMAGGYNGDGALGIGNQVLRPLFVKISGLNDVDVIKIACPNESALALTSNGKIYGWGLNNAGSIGIGNTSITTLPRRISGILDTEFITDVSAGLNAGYALSDIGRLYSWGNDTFGQLGDGGGAGSNQLMPVLMVSGYRFSRLHNTNMSFNVSAYGEPFYDFSPTLYIKGFDRASGIVPFCTVGAGPSSGTIDLYTKAFGVASGSIGLFIVNRTDATPAFVRVVGNNPSESVDLFLRGQVSGVSPTLFGMDGDISLFMNNDGGIVTTNVDFHGFVRVESGVIKFGQSGIASAFVRVGGTFNSYTDLFVKGHTGSQVLGIDASGNLSLFMQGLGDPGSDGFFPVTTLSDGFVRVRDGAIGNISLFIKDEFIRNNTDLFMCGISGTASGMMNGYLFGHAASNNNINLTITGISGIIIGQIPLSLLASETGVLNENIPVYVHGF